MPLPPDVVEPPAAPPVEPRRVRKPSKRELREHRFVHGDHVAYRRRPFLSILLLLGLVVLLAVPVGVGLTAATHKALTAGLTVSEGVHPQQPLVLPPPPQRSTIYAADGSVIGRVYRRFNRWVVPLHDISHATQKAVLAIEDHNFYQHGALDFEAIVRAAIANVRAGQVVQGGSTIAQQLAKNTLTGNAETFARKIQEAEDAIRLENTYTKKQILGMYLNDIYLGNSTYGIAAAGQFYFGKKPSGLSLPEGATLAAIISAPTRFDPILHPTHSIHQRNVVLSRMRTLGWIGKAKYRKAIAAPLGLSDRQRDVASTVPTSYVEQYVINRFLADPTFGKTYTQRVNRLYRGGLKIYTTFEPQFQVEAERAIQRRMSQPGQPQSAVVSIEPSTGAVRAMAVGGQTYDESKYNLATDPGGGRTAGSAFKAFTLAAALEQGMSPNKVFNGDSPKTIPNCGGGQTWRVNNAEPGSGSYTLAAATAASVNAVFAQVVDIVGPKNVARVAHQMGITSPLVDFDKEGNPVGPYCPITLGVYPVSPFEMTSAYSTLANNGVHCKPYAIQKVIGPTGDVVENTHPRCSHVMPAKIAQTETRILEGVISGGTGTAAEIGRPEAGKTGTGQNYQDAWFMGYVPQLTTGVWVGYAAREEPMPNVPGYGTGFGGTLAAPIWHDYMLAATRGMPAKGFKGVHG